VVNCCFPGSYTPSVFSRFQPFLSSYSHVDGCSIEYRDLVPAPLGLPTPLLVVPGTLGLGLIGFHDTRIANSYDFGVVQICWNHEFGSENFRETN
jgi:hypothetical protein